MIGRLIKADMAIAADAQQLHIDAARGTDGFVISAGLRLQIGGVAVGYEMGLHIDAMEQFFLHEGVIAAGMVFRNAAVFIQIIAGALGKIQNPRLMPGDQLLIAADGRRTRSQAQHAVGLANHLGREKHRRRLANLLRRIINMNLHVYSLLMRCFDRFVFIIAHHPSKSQAFLHKNAENGQKKRKNGDRKGKRFGKRRQAGPAMGRALFSCVQNAVRVQLPIGFYNDDR